MAYTGTAYTVMASLFVEAKPHGQLGEPLRMARTTRAAAVLQQLNGVQYVAAGNGSWGLLFKYVLKWSRPYIAMAVCSYGRYSCGLVRLTGATTGAASTCNN